MTHEEQLLQQLMDSSDALVYLKDEDGRFLLVNQRVADLLKVPKEEIIGKTDSDFFPKEQVARFREFDRKVAETGTPVNFEATASFADGEHTILDHKFPIAVEGHAHAVGGIAIEVAQTK